MLKYLRKIRKSNYVICLILIIIYFGNVMFSTLSEQTRREIPDDNKKFAGSASCGRCHKDIYESHIKTAHYLDSRPASKEFIKGSFADGKNKLIYNKWMEVLLEQKKDSFFQTSYINGDAYRRAPFDIVIGSGRKGQTYLYWNDTRLYQLPVSYYTPLNNWCNSPGFSTNYINFDRVIPAQCLECHGTYARWMVNKDSVVIYDKNSIIYGIDCERCHGPAADHVSYYKEHPEDKTAKYIITTKQLNRQQRLDGCALCHSGFRKATSPAFSFHVGDKLDDFSQARYSTDSSSTLDVHGNQYGLLTASKCFRMSKLDCSSCHNVHVNEANNPGIFSQRCIACHSDPKHTSFIFPVNKGSITNNCVDCHMPMLSSRKIVLSVANTDKVVPDQVRTHRVAIYLEKTAEFLKGIKSKQ